jgi:hypothetical protein
VSPPLRSWSIPASSAARTFIESHSRYRSWRARVRHVFARNVLANCGDRCLFCEFTSPSAPGGKLMLLAGHIKPWKDRSVLAASNGLTLPALADELAWTLPRVRTLLSQSDQRPALRIVS